MANEGAQPGGGFAVSWNSILLLLTLLGSILLVSKRLTSHREQTSGTGLNQPIGAQRLETRLWEDPFSVPSAVLAHGNINDEDRIETLVSQVDERVQATNRPLILLVMLSSGSFGEDQESRIRSR